MSELPVNKITIDRDETTPTGKPVSPVPPRFWWLKRILVVSGVLFVILLGVQLWWGWEADRRLQAEIDRIIAAGEPIYPADFDPEPMLQKENAAKLYLDAEAAMGFTPKQYEFVNKLAGDHAEIQGRWDEVEPFVLANAKAFELVHQASDMEKADWGIRARTPVINTLLPNLSVHRYLAKTLSIRTACQIERGEHEQAVSTLLDAFRLAEAVDHSPFLINHLVSVQSRRLLVHDIEYLAPKLGITPKTRELVSLLITDLLDDGSYREAHIRAMQTERMGFLDMAQMLIRGDTGIGSLASWTFGPPSWLERVQTLPLTPTWTRDALIGVQFHSAVVDAARESNWPDAKAGLPSVPLDGSSREQRTRPISGIMLSSPDVAVFRHFHALALTRMAAIALAIRLYEVDFGRRPETLAELVPEYLSAVPVDPLASGSRSIGYLPHAPKPVLYSVGENATDDDGSFASRPNGTLDKSTLDLPFFLNGDRPMRERQLDDMDIESVQGEKEGSIEIDRLDSKQDEPKHRNP